MPGKITKEAEVPAFERPLPVAREAEQMILGCVLLDCSLLAEVDLPPAAFGLPRHRLVFEAMLTIAGRGGQVDPITVSDELRSKDQLEAAGGIAGIASLFDGVPRFTNLDSYVAIVREKYARRELIRAGNYAMTLGWDESESFDGLLDTAQKTICQVDSGQAVDAFLPAGQIGLGEMAAAEAASAAGRRCIGLETGFYQLDFMSCGLKPGDLVILGGRPGAGKTAFAGSLAVQVARSVNNAQRIPGKGGAVVAIFEMEMERGQLTRRLQCGIAAVNGKNYEAGQLTSAEWRALASATDLLNELAIHIDDSAGLSVMDIRKRLRRLEQRTGRLDLVIIDYLQLMRPSGGRRGRDRREEIEEISRDLKVLAKEFRVPVLCLSSLSRSCEARTDKRPMLSDLRESGQIEHDADIVIFTYRESLYRQDASPFTAELIIAKQRSGPIGTVELMFEGPYSRFRDWPAGEDIARR